MKYILLVISILFLLTSCSKKEQEELKISVNPWIGYTPIFYAYEKGYLKDLNIKIIPTVSLGESTDMFSLNKSNMLSGTQHEYKSLKQEFNSLIPIILIDRSYGGDMILSNRTIDELKNSKDIKVYLEIDSINNEMIRSFIKDNKLKHKHITFINKDQAQLQGFNFNKKENIVIVTYTPYDIKLKKDGFNEVASTKDIKELLVVDAIYAKKELVEKNKKRLEKFKNILDQSIKEIEDDPKKAHEITAKYLDNISIDDFKDSLDVIKWINNPSKELIIELEKIGYLKKNLI
jgi:NitT/TauT family transport system substrate-binding protein